ncbi:protein SPIRAL1-like 3 [Cryptomeria japonica]|uniref:protein SPIRAL1-like 3 n=1 Tax=Cryptomeria japonica TaxID=3369 RepID=UPI0025AC1FB4|nr:protein SPIRAL1-like 3 [Cryptomeria japonica]
MGRGVCSGGGQSSLGYLLGGASLPTKDSPSNIHNSKPITNNYQRVDGQNSGNFITDRPSTKVQSVPGGGSSLGYLLGGQK